jgi:hypothetical protein
MAEEKKAEVIEETVTAKKEKAFQEYLDGRKISGFAKQYVGENGEVVLYRSNLQIKGDTVPFMLLLDNSVYTLLQFQVAAGAVNAEKKEKLSAYFNDLNNQFRMLKFTADAAGNVLLSVSLPAGADKFDPALVIAILDQIQGLLNDVYDDLMKKIKE